MSLLFKNAIGSIRIGIEDYASDDSDRVYAAVRSYFAGLLLLAKETLCRRVKNVDVDILLAAKLDVIPDGLGGMKIQAGKNTIDFKTIAERFKSFGIKLSPEENRALSNLQAARNNIEHKHSNLSSLQVQEMIAKSFALQVRLITLCGESPGAALGKVYDTMTEVTEFYESEQKVCSSSFANVQFPFQELDCFAFTCDECGSELMAQVDTANKSHQKIQVRCRSCGYDADAETSIQSAIRRKYEASDYAALMDGGVADLHTCPDCCFETYILHKGCVWCGFVLAECGFCEDKLVPWDISGDDPTLCGYCGHKFSKDD